MNRDLFSILPLVLGALGAGAAAAQTTGAAVAPALSEVTTYPASFFSSARPNTALDMVERLPGFTFEESQTLRGLAGNAGNVIVDGARPTTKTDTLSDVLRRIPADSVARIDVIRGGAPGIDMQGRTIIANVILTTKRRHRRGSDPGTERTRQYRRRTARYRAR